MQLSKVGPQSPYNITLDDDNSTEDVQGLFKAIQEEDESQVKKFYSIAFIVKFNGKKEKISAIAYAAMMNSEKAFNVLLEQGWRGSLFFKDVDKMDKKYSFKVLESFLNDGCVPLSTIEIRAIVVDLADDSIKAYETFKKIVADYYEEENEKIKVVITHISVKPLAIMIRDYLSNPFPDTIWKDFQVRSALSKHIKKT